jgi:hypothetical protein
MAELAPWEEEKAQEMLERVELMRRFYSSRKIQRWWRQHMVIIIFMNSNSGISTLFIFVLFVLFNLEFDDLQQVAYDFRKVVEQLA